MAEAAFRLEDFNDYRYAATGTYSGTAAARPVAQPREIPVERPAVAPRVKPRELPRRRFLSMPSVLGFLLLVALAGAYLMINARLTVAMTELYATKPLYATGEADAERVVGLQSYRDGLLERSRELKIEYERTFDLGAVERYAIERLGMVKAPKAQNTGAVSSDRALIPETAQDTGILGQILEYFIG